MEKPILSNPIITSLEADMLTLTPAGERSIREYLELRPVPMEHKTFDEMLDGGLQHGNYYLFMGPAKSGKSMLLRSIALLLAKNTPVLYLNFEQLGRSTFSGFYGKMRGESLRATLKRDPTLASINVEKMPGVSLYVAFWTDGLPNRSFNVGIRANLEESIKIIERNTGTRPIVVMENLSDIYNERIGGQDSLTNVVSQTIEDIKLFCINHAIILLLAHHTSKLEKDQPTADDVRDSKRVVDKAQNVFCSWSIDNDDGSIDYRFSMLKARECEGAQTRHFYIDYGTDGEIKLTPFVKAKKTDKGKR